LRVIVPLVLYQGERSWSYSSEFADLFAESVRDWPGVPRFSHALIDQSGLQPDEVQGELKAQLMQLVMLAAYHPALAWMERVARLLGSLFSLPPSGGINYVRIFVGYILATQEPEVAQSFRDVLQRHAPAVGDDLMTYAQELLKEGRAEGRAEGEIKAEVRIIENLLREGMEWSAIERVTGVNETQFQALKQQIEDMNE
jgi:predicted transposase/invertase (TIGR01784 family)